MSTAAKLTKTLILHIAVPDIWAEDLDEYAGYLSEPDPPGPKHRLALVTEEWFRADVALALVTIPGDKCQNDEAAVVAREGQIVGVEVVDR